MNSTKQMRVTDLIGALEVYCALHGDPIVVVDNGTKSVLNIEDVCFTQDARQPQGSVRIIVKHDVRP